MKKLTLFLFMLTIIVSASAQKRIEILSVSDQYNFMSTEGSDSKNYENYFNAALTVPLVLKDSSIWYTNIMYQNFAVNNTYDANFPLMESFNVGGIILRTGYIHRLNAKQYLHFLLAPRYMSDFNASFGNSFQMGGVLLYEKRKSKTYTYRVGALFNMDFFSAYLIPIFYLDWDVSSKFKINGMLPIYGKAYYQASPNFSAGFHFVGLTTSYAIDQATFNDHYIDRRSIDVSLFSNVHIWDNVYLEGRVGYSLAKDYQLYDKGDKIDFAIPLVDFGDDRTRLNSEYESGAFVLLKLIYSLPID